MTRLELLAAKVRGADSNEDGARIIADWYDSQVKHSINNSRESARICRDNAAKFGGATEVILRSVAKNFEASADLLEFDRYE